MRAEAFISWLFQRYWRYSRSLPLAVECCIEDSAGGILLVKDQSGTCWKLPRGDVLRGESAGLAVHRLIKNSAIAPVTAPTLISIEAPDAAGEPYVALYAARVEQLFESDAGVNKTLRVAYRNEAFPKELAPGSISRIRQFENWRQTRNARSG